MNPYEVLGVSPYASPDEIRSAYLKLVKKYHPDRYQDSCLKKQAEDKMKRINAAYDMIMKKLEAEAKEAQKTPRSSAAASDNEPVYNTIRGMINKGDILGAIAALTSMHVRDAQWHFLYGICCYRNGQYSRAYEYISRASRMDPENHEYASALNTMRGTTRTGGSSPDLKDAALCCGIVSTAVCSNVLCRWCC